MRHHIALSLGVALLLVGSFLGYQRFVEFSARPVTIRTNVQTTRPEPIVLPATNGLVEGKPVRIVIPSVNIDVPVLDGIYNPHTQTWTLSETAAQYALITQLANNQTGNTFIYGHNRTAVFKRLLDAKEGAIAKVYTTNNHVFTYKLRATKVTNPRDDSLFYYKGSPILTVQTCSGLWFQNRSLFTFDYVAVQ